LSKRMTDVCGSGSSRNGFRRRRALPEKQSEREAEERGGQRNARILF
jgi:hypothetical protein